jgi:hypothetical protein
MCPARSVTYVSGRSQSLTFSRSLASEPLVRLLWVSRTKWRVRQGLRDRRPWRLGHPIGAPITIRLPTLLSKGSKDAVFATIDDLIFLRLPPARTRGFVFRIDSPLSSHRLTAWLWRFRSRNNMALQKGPTLSWPSTLRPRPVSQSTSIRHDRGSRFYAAALLPIRVIRVRLASGARSSLCDLHRENGIAAGNSRHIAISIIAVCRCENLEVNRVTQLRDQDH